MKKILLIILASVFLSGCGAKYYYDRGQKEFHEQNYHQAFADTLSAAKYGNVEAQYATGYMYYYGIGVEQNDYMAQSWFAKAAAVGDPKSIAALKQVNQTAQNPLLFGMDKTQKAPNPPKPSIDKVHANAAVNVSRNMRPAPSNYQSSAHTYSEGGVKVAAAEPAAKPIHKNPHAKYKTAPKPKPSSTAVKRLPAIPAPHTTYAK